MPGNSKPHKQPDAAHAERVDPLVLPDVATQPHPTASASSLPLPSAGHDANPAPASPKPVKRGGREPRNSRGQPKKPRTEA